MKLRMLLTLALRCGLVHRPPQARRPRKRVSTTTPSATPYYDKLKGKKVIFVPLAMGFDLTEGWAAIMRRQAKDLGYNFEIRDPNWSTDAGTAPSPQAIAEKPDLADRPQSRPAVLRPA